MGDYPALDAGQRFTASRVFYPTGDYEHPPNGLLQLRVVRQGSSYAWIDLGQGLRHVLTRPGDLLLSLGDRGTVFRLESGREMTLLQADRRAVDPVLDQLGSGLEELTQLCRRPFREPFIAELCRRLEALNERTGPERDWCLGLILATLLDCARARRATAKQKLLTTGRLDHIKREIDARIEDVVSVADLAASAEMPTRAFSAAFREATGLPVHQFVLRRRAALASQLLAETSLTLAEIAQRA